MGAAHAGQRCAVTLPSAAERLTSLLAAAPFGVDLTRFGAAQGLRELLPDSVPKHALTQAGLALGATQAEAFEGATLSALQTFNGKPPDEPGPDTARLRRLAAPRLIDAVCLRRGGIAATCDRPG